MTWARVTGSLVTRQTRVAIDADERRLLDAVVAEPDQDAPRLVYADWLITRTDPQLAARGELIVVQCALEQLQDTDEHNRLKARDFELVERHGNTWCAHVGLGAVRYNWYDSEWEADFQRGFIETVSLPASEYPGVAGPLFTNEPVRRLVLLGAHAEVMARLPGSVYLRRLQSLALRGQWRTDFGQRYLMDSALGAATLAAIASSGHVANLQRLEVADHQIGDAGSDAIARAPSLGALRELCLRSTGIGPQGALALACSRLAAQLEVLVLDGNPIGDEAARYFASAPQRASLRRLSLAGIELGDKTRRRLVERFGTAVEL